MSEAAGAAPPSTPKGFMQDDAGNNSAMRLMSFVSLLAAISFGMIAILADVNDSTDGVMIVFGFLIGAFAPKAVQKFAETKVPGR